MNKYLIFRELKKNKIVFVILTSELCGACCKHELFYHNLIHYYLKNKNSNPFVKKTKIL